MERASRKVRPALFFQIMSPKFEAAFLRHAALSLEKQLALQDVIGERNWNFDMGLRQLRFEKKGVFGKPLDFDVQILGSVSESDASWLWSWANPSVDEKLTRASLFLREKGELEEFGTPELSLDLEEADDSRLVMTSVGVLATLFGCDAYYRGPYEGGAAFFLLRDPRLHLKAPDAVHIATVFPQLLSGLSISDHRAALLGYLDTRGLEANIEGEQVRALVGTSSLVADFDDSNRLAQLRVVANS